MVDVLDGLQSGVTRAVSSPPSRPDYDEFRTRMNWSEAVLCPDGQRLVVAGWDRTVRGAAGDSVAPALPDKEPLSGGAASLGAGWSEVVRLATRPPNSWPEQAVERRAMQELLTLEAAKKYIGWPSSPTAARSFRQPTTRQKSTFD
jgi:hypothetical protein